MAEMSNECGSKFTFTWKIENFSLCPQDTGEFLTSPPFTTENVGDSMWLLLIYPRGKDKNEEEYISLFLTRFKGDIHTGVNNIGVELKIIGTNDKILSIVKEDVILHEGDTWGSKQFFKRLLLEKMMENWKEDSITISCTIINNKKLLKSEARTIVNKKFDSFERNVKIHDIMNGVLEFDTTLFKIYLKNLGGYINLTMSKQENVVSFPKCVTCKISLLDKHDCEMKSKRFAYSFLSDEARQLESHRFITIEYLKENEDSIIKNGSFTLLFNFSFLKGEELTHILNPEGNNFSKQKNLISLKENFKNMYSSKLHSDVEFRVDGQRFNAHKAILAARSPVFLAMFERDMLERRTGIVNIPDIEGNIFGIFLEYFYTATVDNMDWETASKLLLIADRYQVESLKVDCSCFLKSSLNKMNLYEVLESSDMINYKHLKEFVFGYIADNSEKIFNSQQWIDWAERNESLSAEMEHFLNS